MLLGPQDFRSAGWEAGFPHGALEPAEQLAVESAVQLLGVQRVQPRGQQAVEVVLLVVTVHPPQAVVQRELREDVHVRAVGPGGVDFAYERDAADDVALRVALVRAHVDESEC